MPLRASGGASVGCDCNRRVQQHRDERQEQGQSHRRRRERTHARTLALARTDRRTKCSDGVPPAATEREVDTHANTNVPVGTMKSATIAPLALVFAALVACQTGKSYDLSV